MTARTIAWTIVNIDDDIDNDTDLGMEDATDFGIDDGTDFGNDYSDDGISTNDELDSNTIGKDNGVDKKNGGNSRFMFLIGIKNTALSKTRQRGILISPIRMYFGGFAQKYKFVAVRRVQKVWEVVDPRCIHS